MQEEKGERKVSDDPQPDSNEFVEVSLDFDEADKNKRSSEKKVEEEDVFEMTPIDEMELALEMEKDSAKELYDKYLRLQAEFDNYRKRMNNYIEEAKEYASEGILLKLLDVFDNLERSLNIEHKNDQEGTKAGVKAIHQQMEKIFAAEKVRRIDSKGREFDPYYHNSINTINNDNQPDNMIVDVYQEGYMFRERVLRPAIVCVNRHKPVVSDEKDEKVKHDDEASEHRKAAESDAQASSSTDFNAESRKVNEKDQK
ncbi:MAG: nucleotide exchange factor GrpE [Candidatus Thorarchaeota archaeon]